MIILYTSNTKNISENGFKMAKLFLSEPEKMRVKKYKKKKDKKNFIIGRYLIKKAIYDYLKIPEDRIIIKTDKFNRPYLSDRSKKIDFNISHSGDLVVCAISDNKIGVDVEIIKKIDLGLSNQVFSENEKKYIYQDKKNRLFRFFQIWTLKESYIKAVGKGFLVDVKKISFVIKENKISVYNGTRLQKYFFHIINLKNKSLIALCFQKKDDTITVKETNI